MYTKNKNPQIIIDQVNNLFNFVAKIKYCYEKKIKSKKYEIGTAFFIKLKVGKDNGEIPYICTAYHVFEKLPENFYDDGGNKGTIRLIFIRDNKEKAIDFVIKKNNSDKNGEIKRDIIILNDLDLIFIQILKKDNIPTDVQYFEFDENDNYFKNYSYFKENYIIITGFHNLKMKEEEKRKESKIPFQTMGPIIEIEKDEKNGICHYNIIYKVETNNGLSGAPVCLINDKYKLIGYHISSSRLDNYNIGKIFPPIDIIKKGSIVDKIPINKISNNNNDCDILLVRNNNFNIKEFEDTLKKIFEKRKEKQIDSDNIALSLFNCYDEKLKQNILLDENYIFDYFNEIIKEINNKGNERYLLFYKSIKEFISKNNMQNELKLPPSIIMEIIKNFKEPEDLKQIISNIDNIITFFNKVLLLENNILLARSTYFIANLINILDINNYKYNENDSNLYCRIKLSYEKIIKLEQLLESENQRIITFRQFLKVKIINNKTIINRFFYDLKKNIKYIRDMILETNDGYDTLINIHQKFDTNNFTNNFFQINFSDVIICPFSFFRIEKIERNEDDFTAEIDLTSIGIKPSVMQRQYYKENDKLYYDEANKIIDINIISNF